ncbi:MAG: TolC family outer membrane protein [Alphaproteobacteria bacterium]|nr:TolC family outer membrane protein [Alphaproteobacteria bacterium]
MPSRTLSIAKVLSGTAIAAFLAAGTPVQAQTLSEALVEAYQTNPDLAASRAQLRQSDEALGGAVAAWRPTVTLNGSVSVSRQEQEFSTGTSTEDTLTPSSLSLTLSQPVWQGGRISANIDSAEFAVQSRRASLVGVEQGVFVDVSTAYLNVLRDTAVLRLQQNNEERLVQQLEAARDRFQVGEVTRTDVAQAEARLQEAIAGRIQAEGALQISREAYRRSVGSYPSQLSAPDIQYSLPQTSEAARELAGRENPNVVAARFDVAEQRRLVRSVTAGILPQINLQLQASEARDTGTTTESSSDLSAGLTASVPLYEGGQVAAQIRQQREVESQAMASLEGQTRLAVNQAATAFEQLLTAQAQIDSFRSQVAAAEIALEGVQEEAAVGSRTTLDILDAEQELLNAQVNLVVAERDEIVAELNVLAAIGRMTAIDLGLPVTPYDFEKSYREARADYWPWDDVFEALSQD